MNFDFQTWLLQKQNLIENELSSILTKYDQNTDLLPAMRYSSLGGGKRIRPALMFSVAKMFGVKDAYTSTASCSLELIHCYSLIHDDLPAMDDDDMRRGQPSCHIKYNEATAILAGDALQSLAFKALSKAKFNNDIKVKLIEILSTASLDMAIGQSMDIAKKKYSLDELHDIHQYKTGSLINAAVLMGGTLGNANEEELAIIKNIGIHLGAAFQIQDDILDATTSSKILGKPAGSDAAANKTTYISLIGISKAKEQALEHYNKFISESNKLNYDTSCLVALGNFIIYRNS